MSIRLDSIVIPSENRVLQLITLLSLGLIFGLFVGYTLGNTPIQTALEHAQVLARLVEYPQDTPASLFYKEAWSGLHQVLALALKLGFSETTLSLALGCSQAILSATWIALLVFGLTRQTLFSILIVPVIFTLFDGGMIPDFKYKIFLFQTNHTSGALGMGWCALVIACLIHGWFRAAGILTALGICIHPLLLGYLGLIFSLTAFLYRKDYPRSSAQFLKSEAALLWLPLLSKGIQMWLFPSSFGDENSRIEPESYLRFVRQWDYHRGYALSYFLNFNTGVFSLLLLGLCGLLICHYKTTSRRAKTNQELTWSGMILFTVLAIVLLISNILIQHFLKITHFFPFLIHLVRIMPGRLLNLNLILFLPLVFAFFWNALLRMKQNFCIRVLIGILMLSLAMVDLQFIKRGIERYHHLPLRFSFDTTGFEKDTSTQPYLLGFPFNYFQFFTRKPIYFGLYLLDGLGYSPELLGWSQLSLKEIYGIQFENQTDSSFWNSESWERLQSGVQSLFESRNSTTWTQLGFKYHFDRVIVEKSWSLQLPLFQENLSTRTYQVPSF